MNTTSIDLLKELIRQAYVAYQTNQMELYHSIVNERLSELLKKSEFQKQENGFLEKTIEAEFQRMENAWLVAECVALRLREEDRSALSKPMPWYRKLLFFRIKKRTHANPKFPQTGPSCGATKIDAKNFFDTLKKQH